MELIKKLKDKKGSFIIASLILVGILLLLLPSKSASEEETVKGQTISEITTYTEKLEERIHSLCSAVSGTGNVTVLVTLECGSEFVYANNRTEELGENSSAYSSDYLIIENKNGSEPVTVTEIYPKIRGVAVVCDGGENAAVKEKLTRLLSAALGISTSRISVTS